MQPRLQNLVLLFALGTLLLGGVSCGGDDSSDNETEDSEVSGLYEGSQGVVFDLGIDPDPPQAGEVELIMEISQDDQPIEEATIEVEPWMPAHGHGANTEAVVHEVGDGVYEVDDLSFSMPGHWELAIDLEAQQTDSTLVVELDVEG